MKIMLDLSPAGIADRTERFGVDFWQLRTPLTRYALAGVPYGLDNGCFGGELKNDWYRLLEEAETNRPVFVCLPDIVGSARRTMDLFTHFERRTNGLPRALVLQDGIGDVEIPWSKIEAVFIGGSDAFKIAPEAIAAARCAKMLDKWVHVGRVNEPKRVANWHGLADSIDGSGISRYDHMLRDVVAAIAGDHPQTALPIGKDWDRNYYPTA
jgi:hypothetical protein